MIQTARQHDIKTQDSSFIKRDRRHEAMHRIKTLASRKISYKFGPVKRSALNFQSAPHTERNLHLNKYEKERRKTPSHYLNRVVKQYSDAMVRHADYAMCLLHHKKKS